MTADDYSTQDFNPALSSPSLAESVERAVRQYFYDLHEETPSEVYALMLGQFEKPLLQVVLEHTHYNQSQAAQILGLNRGTLRRKMQAYGLLDKA